MVTSHRERSVAQHDTRRDFLKKAGIAGAGVTAAAWAAPSITSIDAAAAATCPVSNPITGIGGANYWSYAFWATSLGLANGADVASWANQGTFGGTAVAVTTGFGSGIGSGSYVTAGLNGKPVVRAKTDPGVEGLTRLITPTAATPISQPLTLVVIGSLVPVPGTGTSARDFMVDSLSDTNRIGIFNNQAGTNPAVAYSSGSSTSTATTNAAVHLWFVQAIGGTSGLTMNIDGTSVLTASGTAATTGLSLFARAPSLVSANGNGGMGGDLAFVGVRAGTMTAQERTALISFATCVYGLTVSPF